MYRHVKPIACLTACCALLFAGATVALAEDAKGEGGEKTSENPVVVLKTTMGDIEIELYPDKAPISVENFLQYVDDGHYAGTIFHRVIPNFMIQGGGFTPDIQQKSVRDPIKNEADNGLTNDVGTVAMARTREVDSATAQFFINTKNNDFLNHGVRDFGYAVFGRVVGGMDVVKNIEKVPTGARRPLPSDVPMTPIVIESVERK